MKNPTVDDKEPIIPINDEFNAVDLDSSDEVFYYEEHKHKILKILTDESTTEESDTVEETQSPTLNSENIGICHLCEKKAILVKKSDPILCELCSSCDEFFTSSEDKPKPKNLTDQIVQGKELISPILKIEVNHDCRVETDGLCIFCERISSKYKKYGFDFCDECNNWLRKICLKKSRVHEIESILRTKTGEALGIFDIRKTPWMKPTIEKTPYI